MFNFLKYTRVHDKVVAWFDVGKSWIEAVEELVAGDQT